VPFREHRLYQAFIKGQEDRAEGLSERIQKQIFESDSYESYTQHVKQFADFRSPLKTLKNESVVFWNGKPITHYLKSSYMKEADPLLEERLYLLGRGIDEINPEVTSGLHDMVSIITKYLSTEICYDLEIGVRKKLNSYPPEGKIHIVVSNTLSLAQLGSAENLPDHIPLIIHVDPKDQEILLKNEVQATLYPLSSSDMAGDPLHSVRYNQFTKAMPLATFRVNLTPNNVFIFHIWDLQQCLQIASLH
jgi:hypothetical protein